MQLWKITLAYDGGPFHGWQVQPGLPTVQGTLASVLKRLTGETVLPQGSGRTDTGVHALGQVASFALEAPIPPSRLERALNRALPPAIRVLTAEHAPEGFHARHSALRKTYEYRIFHRPPAPGLTGGEREVGRDRVCSPMLAPYVWDLPYPLEVSRAQAAAAHVVGEHDFTSFAASDPDRTARASEGEVSNVRRVDASVFSVETNEGEPMLVYRVTGTGFLHHMVRNLVGTFMDIALGRRETDEVPAMLAARTRAATGPTAPPHGLFLRQVEY